MLSFDYTNENHIIFLLLAIVILALAFFVVKIKLKEYFQKRLVKKRFDRGNKLEVQAKSFLRNNGYDIIDYQGVYPHKYWVDGELQQADITPDYVVRKGGKKYIVEVKSGTSAISARNRSTRRQLLEYDYAIENDGVLLLDMESRTLSNIQFKSKVERRSNTLLRVTIFIAVIGFFIPFWEVKVVLLLPLTVIFFRQRF